jgi:hypothetical protein
VNLTISEAFAALEELLLAGGIAAACAWLAYGLDPWLRKRDLRQLRRREKIRFSADVNTELAGLKVRKNHWDVAYWCVALILFSFATSGFVRVLGDFAGIYMLVRHFFVQRPFQALQSICLTERRLHVWWERQGQPLWKGTHSRSWSWKEFEGYRIDGSLLQFYEGENLVCQVEYDVKDYHLVRTTLFHLNVPRLDLYDRVWVAQVDESWFYRLEDDLCSIAWEYLDLFEEEMNRLRLRPELGVMRNIQGDRLLDESARSWLQLNWLDSQSDERVAASGFSLWHSSGSVGFLIGAIDQDLVDRVGEWIRDALRDAETAREGGGS